MIYMTYINLILISIVAFVHAYRGYEGWWYIALLMIPAYLVYHFTWKLLEEDD